MSTDRLLVLLAVAAAGALIGLGYSVYRRRNTPGPDFLDVDAMGLELMSGCCAFVLFSTAACRPCKAALRVVERAAAAKPGLTEVVVLDAIERVDLATRYDVRTIPTVFLITASGHVLRRWKDVPDRTEVDEALAAI